MFLYKVDVHQALNLLICLHRAHRLKLICILTESLSIFGEVHFYIGDIANVSLGEDAKDLLLLDGLYVASFKLDQVV